MHSRSRQRLAALLILTASGVLFTTPARAQNTLVEKAVRAVTLAQGLKEATNPASIPNAEDLQRRGFGIVREGELERDLNQILQDLQRPMVQPAPKAKIYVTPDPAFRAFATAEGAIFIAAGALASMESRDEVAALVAHEYAHVLLGHGRQSSQQQALKSLQGLGSLYLATRFADSNVEQADWKSTVVRQSILHSLAVESLQTGLIPQRARKEETAADHRALELLVAAGYNPVALFELLERMQAWEEKQEQARKAQQAALTDVKSAMQSMAANGDLGGAVVTGVMGSLGNVMTTAFQSAEGGLRKLARNHIEPEKRLELVRQQLREDFPDLERPESRPVPWKDRPVASKVFAGIEDVHSLMTAMQGNGSDPQINRLASQVRASPVAMTPYARFALLHLYDPTRGKRSAVQTALHTELKRPDSLFTAHFLILDLLSQVGSPEEQVQALELSRSTLGDPPELAPYEVATYKRANNPQKLNQAMARCLGRGHRDLTSLCEARQKK